tara:strand:- start:433 stop:810 length:378 start_codon:yes stop_codon:yes gene_type:complete
VGEAISFFLRAFEFSRKIAIFLRPCYAGGLKEPCLEKSPKKEKSLKITKPPKVLDPLKFFRDELFLFVLARRFTFCTKGNVHTRFYFYIGIILIPGELLVLGIISKPGAENTPAIFDFFSSLIFI